MRLPFQGLKHQEISETKASFVWQTNPSDKRRYPLHAENLDNAIVYLHRE